MVKCKKCFFSHLISECRRNETSNPHTGAYDGNSTDRSLNDTGNCSSYRKRRWWETRD